MDTSAKSRGGRVAVPAKITSSMPPPRSDLGLDSPIAQRIASRRLDLPQPLGPTTPVRPGSMRSSAGSTKLLKPLSLSRRIRKLSPSPFVGLASLAKRGAQLRLELHPCCRVLHHRPVDDERRRALELRKLRRRVAIHLDQLVDRALIGQALRALRLGNPAHRGPRLKVGDLCHLQELLVRRQVLQAFELLLRRGLDLAHPVHLVLVEGACEREEALHSVAAGDESCRKVETVTHIV